MVEALENGQVKLGSKRVARLIAIAERRRAALSAKRALALGYVSCLECSVPADEQHQAIRSYADAHGLTLTGVVFEHTNDTDTLRLRARPGFETLCRLADDETFGTLIVYRSACLTTDVGEAIAAAADLRDGHEVTIRSATEPEIDTASPSGMLGLALLLNGAARGAAS